MENDAFCCHIILGWISEVRIHKQAIMQIIYVCKTLLYEKGNKCAPVSQIQEIGDLIYTSLSSWFMWVTERELRLKQNIAAESRFLDLHETYSIL